MKPTPCKQISLRKLLASCDIEKIRRTLIAAGIPEKMTSAILTNFAGDVVDALDLLGYGVAYHLQLTHFDPDQRDELLEQILDENHDARR